MASALAPRIQITSPNAAADPNVDAVIIDNQITVTCDVTQSTAKGAAAVDPATVQIELLDADGKSIKSMSGVPTQNDNEYAASFSLTLVASGPLTVRCGASDKASPANSASASIDTFVDHGPEVGAVQPTENSPHNLLGPMTVEFATAPVPLTKADKQAAVSGVTLMIGGVEIPTMAAGSGSYKATVNFSDKSLFSAPPTGKVPVLIKARNQRKAPDKASASLAYTFVLDGTGPAIALGSPVVNAVVGRASVLTFTVTDALSGIEPVDVLVRLNSVDYPFSSTDGKWTSTTDGQYSFLFGGELLASNKGDTQVTVNVLAKDRAGNSSLGMSRLYNLDNQPPLVDLDPPNAYIVRAGTSAAKKQCSDYFDPVGEGAPSDLGTITNFGRFRALVYDLTNEKPGQTDFFYAGPNKDSVQLFVQYDNSSPLLADDDMDGVCDEIWTGSPPHQKKPTDKPIPFLGLKQLLPNMGLPRGGVSFHSAEIDSNLGCMGGQQNSFPALCKDNSSDMSVVVHHDNGNTEPIIYAIQPSDSSTDLLCTGQPWDVSTAISTSAGGTTTPGWVCLAARALDNVGNPGVSAPIRICLDDGTSSDGCKNDPPSCTDNCTPPPHLSANSILSVN